MRGNGYERELKTSLARLPKHKKMSEHTKKRMLQTLISEEQKLKKERNWHPLRTKIKWTALTLAAGLILVISAFSLKDQLYSPRTGETQGTHTVKAEHPLATLNGEDIQSILVTDGKTGDKVTIDDPQRIKKVIATLTNAQLKLIKSEDIKGYQYLLDFKTNDDTTRVIFFGDLIKVKNHYYSIGNDVSSQMTSLVESSQSEDTSTQNNQQPPKEDPTTTNITMTKVARFNMSDGVGWLQSDQSIAFTQDAGLHWTNVTPAGGIDSNMEPKMYVNGKNAWIATYKGDRAVVYRSTDGGAHWSKKTFKTKVQMIGVISIQFLDDHQGFLLLSGDVATGNQGVAIYKTTDSGSTWTLQGANFPIQKGGSLPYSGLKNGVSFKNAMTGWLTGLDYSDEPYLYQTNDGGHSWVKQALKVPKGGFTAEGGSSMTYSPIFFNDKDGILPVKLGNDHPYLFYSTHDGGVTWVPGQDSIKPDKNSYELNDWDFVNQNVGFATVGNQLFVTKDSGAHWTVININRELAKIDFQSEKDGFAMSGGQLVKTSDGGHTWETVTTFK